MGLLRVRTVGSKATGTHRGLRLGRPHHAHHPLPHLRLRDALEPLQRRPGPARVNLEQLRPGSDRGRPRAPSSTAPIPGDSSTSSTRRPAPVTGDVFRRRRVASMPCTMLGLCSGIATGAALRKLHTCCRVAQRHGPDARTSPRPGSWCGGSRPRRLRAEWVDPAQVKPKAPPVPPTRRARSLERELGDLVVRPAPAAPMSSKARTRYRPPGLQRGCSTRRLPPGTEGSRRSNGRPSAEVTVEEQACASGQRGRVGLVL